MVMCSTWNVSLFYIDQIDNDFLDIKPDKIVWYQRERARKREWVSEWVWERERERDLVSKKGFFITGSAISLSLSFIPTLLSIITYIYVCIYVCMYVCMNICMYVCMNICMYVWIYVCMYVYMYVSIYVFIMYVCMYIFMYVYMYVCIYLLHFITIIGIYFFYF